MTTTPGRGCPVPEETEEEKRLRLAALLGARDQRAKDAYDRKIADREAAEAAQEITLF